MFGYIDRLDTRKTVQPWSNYLASTLIVTMTVIFCSTNSSLAAAPLSTMALPDWAYAERQRLAPILVRGEVMEVSCHEVQCTLKMQILQVLRNQSQRSIELGDVLSINFVGQVSPELRILSQNPPPIGAPVVSVKIPNVGDQTDAWLRPAESDSNTYDLTADKYGFGPDIESLEVTTQVER